MRFIEVKEIGENEDEESHQNTSEERKENIYKKERSRQTAERTSVLRQAGDGWMDVGFFDVNARGNTSSIMATTAVVNFYILRATPLPREPPTTTLVYPPTFPTQLKGQFLHSKQRLCGYEHQSDQKFRVS
jgi:muconolactone delta-isomerase